MPDPPPGRRRPLALTLLALLAAAGVLAAATVLALVHPREQRPTPSGLSQLQCLRSALAMYEADMGRFPRTEPPDRGAPSALLRDDGPALHALRLARAQGGGPNAPYVEWRDVGRVVDPRRLETGPGPAAGGAVAPLTPEEAAAPPGDERRVLLDPWGNPWHYREWASVRPAHKEALARTPVRRTGLAAAASPGEAGAPPVDEALDGPHDLDGYDLWSNGPNGVDELGAGDDIASWRHR